MTTVNEVVRILQTQFQSYTNRYTDKLMYHGNAFTKFESEKTVRDLVALLSARTNDEQEANEASLGFLIEFLQNRCERIQKTQSMYNHSPLTLANRWCLEVANQLAAVTQTSRYAYLYPFIKEKLAAYESEKGKIDVLEPWEFVFDNDWNPIDVVLALKYVIESDSGVATHTNLAMKEVPIDLESSSRVFTCHANCVLYAYNPQNRVTDPVVIPEKLSAEEVADFDRASYGEEGLMRQREMMKLDSLPQFAEMLVGEYEKIKNLKFSMNSDEWSKRWKTEWESIWKTFVTPAVRKRLISDNMDAQFFQKLQSPASYRKGDLIFNRAVLFCFISYYIDDRRAGPEHTGYGGLLGVGATKEQKLMAAGHFQQFITSEYSLDRFLDKCIGENR